MPWRENAAHSPPVGARRLVRPPLVAPHERCHPVSPAPVFWKLTKADPFLHAEGLEMSRAALTRD